MDEAVTQDGTRLHIKDWGAGRPVVMTHCGADDAVLLGFSMGAGEVARYMTRHQERGVAQAVLMSSVLPYMLKTANNHDGVDPSVFDKMTEAMTRDRVGILASHKDRLAADVLAFVKP